MFEAFFFKYYVVKQTLVAMVALQYFCGSGRTYNIKRRGTKEYNNDDYLHFSKK